MILRGQHRIFSECFLTFMKQRVYHTSQNTALPLISAVKMSFEVRYFTITEHLYEVQDYIPNNLVSTKLLLNTHPLKAW